MKRKGANFTQSKPYVKFIEDRDRALDGILFKYRVLASNILNHLEQQTKHKVLGLYANGQLTYRTADNEQLINFLRSIFIPAIRDTVSLYQQATRRAYVLAHVGEAEAIGRTKVKQARYEINLNPNDDKTMHRIRIYYERLLRKVIDQVQRATLNASSVQDFKDYLDKAFPSKQSYVRPPRALKKLTEAKRVGPFILSDKEADELEEEFAEEFSSRFAITQLSKATDMATGLVSQEDWNGLVEDYKRDYIDPVTIFGRTEKIYKVGGDEVYAWELDRDLTHEFVTQVRSGQVDAAKQNGITDFVWIAIVDNKTDECCLWRDGLTTKEIEEELPKHDEDCDGAVTPPAHVYCRCRLAPYEPDVDEAQYEDLPNYGEFDEWINS